MKISREDRRVGVIRQHRGAKKEAVASLLQFMAEPNGPTTFVPADGALSRQYFVYTKNLESIGSMFAANPREALKIVLASKCQIVVEIDDMDLVEMGTGIWLIYVAQGEYIVKGK